ncbi:hypothetical protein PBRA_009151 [Plasmodiophora brassicae]|uniref:ABC transporter domain-containing protein n=1 Tax=Plasmodiophora brassicae TaxID=37360 RepID=A0A0G4J4W6_PLABS|nr:hypothetical protein PBRA_009151 [Plasmodiophora brassicae]
MADGQGACRDGTSPATVSDVSRLKRDVSFSPVDRGAEPNACGIDSNGGAIAEQFARFMRLQQEAGLVEQPATLSWRHVSYTKDGQRIFEPLSGFLHPGMLVCCLGPPDSGVSSLLRVLSGRQQGGCVRGEILVNGLATGPTFRKIVSYVPFDDLHIEHMTVREAVRFSTALRSSPRLPERAVDHHVRLILHLLNLSHRADSRIGSATIRGISGGERRRLTIALEMALGHAVMLMDSPTNGLDSSSAMDLVDIARNLCDHAGRSALMALVQVSPDLFARFDHVLCMSHGALIYFGPVSDALPYMESLGYRKPPQRTTPDFLSDICARPMEHFVGNVMRPNPFAGRMGDRQYFPSIVADLFCDRGSVGDLSQAYLGSAMDEEVGRVLWEQQRLSTARRHDKADPGTPPAVSNRTASKFNSSPGAQFATCLTRAALVSVRERSKLFSRLTRAWIVGVVIGAVFWRLDSSQSGSMSFLGAFATVTGFIAYDAIEEIPQIFQSRSGTSERAISSNEDPGFERWASIVADLPVLVAQALLTAVLVYGMTNMRDGVLSARFVVFCAAILQLSFIGRALVTFIANVVPHEGAAGMVAIIANNFFWYYQGYMCPAPLIPRFLQWLNFVSYFKRLYEALAINEFAGRPLDCEPSHLCRWANGSELLVEYGWDQARSPWMLLAQSFVFLGLFHACALTCMLFLNFETGGGVEEAQRCRAHPSDDDGIVSVPMVAEKNEDAVVDRAAHLPILTVESLCYSIGNRTLLTDVSLFAQPGMLMGASGAGKTTLLDVLAGRKNTGAVTGRVRVNGSDRDRLDFRRACAFVEQFDALPSFCTVRVREVVECSAELRLPPDIDDRSRRAIVDDVLGTLGLLRWQDLMATDLGGALRKKVSIALELAAIRNGAGFLFCDEATTGLDAPAALDVVDSLVAVSRHTPVFCTIHQPSSQILDRFNWILLLRPGGAQAYFGPTALLDDFCRRAGYPGRDPDENLAEYALRTVCAEAPARNVHPNPVPAPDVVVPSAPAARRRRPGRVSSLTTFRVLLRRRFRCELRDTTYLSTRFLCLLVFSCMVGFMFLHLPYTYDGIVARIACCFAIVNNLAWAQQAKISYIVNERPCYYRELALGMYGETSYYLASALAETPFLMAQAVCLGVPAYLLAGLSLSSPATPLLYLATLWLSAEASCSTISLITALSPNAVVAFAILSAVYTMYAAFGFLLVYSAMPVFTLGFYYASFFRWALFANVSGEMLAIGDVSVDCNDSGLASGTCTDSILQTFGIVPDQQWMYIAGLVAVGIAYRALAIVALKAIKHIKR